MGFESYGVTIRGGAATSQEAITAVAKVKNARPDPESALTSGASYFVIEDGVHAIEVEVMHSPVMVSCRFTLCHPSTVDAAFIALVRELLSALGSGAKICDVDTAGESHKFTLANYEDFASIIPISIAKERQEWKAAFGDRELAATTPEVHERIILPLCLAPIENAG